MTELGDHKGKPVLFTSATVAKANNRLSETLMIKPRIFDVDETVFAIVRLVKSKDRYDYIKDVDNTVLGVEHVQMFDARSAVFFDEEDKDSMMGSVLQQAVDMFIEAEALKKGQLTMTLTELDDDDQGN